MASNIEALYIEIDLPYCALNFGVSPCTATGTPCFNTRNNSYDCQDIPNYTATTQTVRIVKYNGYNFWPNDGVPWFPFLESAESKSAVLDPGESMGSRAKCNIKLGNGQSLLQGLDKYINDRDEADYYKGSFLGKFKARNPYIFGSEVRVYRGTVGGLFEVEHYIIENWSGPSAQNGMTIQCVDFLKLLNGDKSNYPQPSEGVLQADINKTDTTFDVQAGFGAAYPASGLIAIGNEAMSFARVDDTFTVVRDGPNSLGEVEEHKAGETVQIVGQFAGQNSAEIINELITSSSPLGSSYIPLTEWQDEISTFQSSVYSANIVSPTPVNKLINELCQQAGLIFWADVKAKKIRLKVLRPIGTANAINEDRMIGFNQTELQSERVSQVWVRYNQKNPFKKLDDESNYYSRIIAPTVENLYQTESIKKIYSRWIPSGGQSNAIDVATRHIERYRNPPREFSFEIFRDNSAPLGEGRIVSHSFIEDAFGDPSSAPTYIVSSKRRGATKQIVAKEFVFSDYSLEGGGSDIVVPIEGEFYENIDLKQYFLNSVRSSLTGVTSVTFIIKSGTVVGSYLQSLHAMTIGDFGAITPLLVIENGAFLVGKGGDGLFNYESSNNIGPGGPALNADYPVDIQNNGVIGGGGGASGLGTYKVNNLKLQQNIDFTSVQAIPGAGYRFGQATPPTLDVSLYSTVELGATKAQHDALMNQIGDLEYSFYGNGGNLGQAGTAGNQGPGFPAGAAVDNNSNVNWISSGTILGDLNG